MAQQVVEGDQIAIIIADLDRFTTREVVALGLNINANLRENPPLGTPIDTGWASANWVPSVGEPAIFAADVRDPSPGLVAARQQLADRGLNRIIAWQPSDGPIFSTNNVPYIQPLNDGHSPQSPRGFVQFSLEAAVRQTYSAGASKASRGRRAGAARAAKPRRV